MQDDAGEYVLPDEFKPYFGTHWSDDPQVRNALLHAIETLKGGKADTYDIDAIVGSLIGDGMKVVSADD